MAEAIASAINNELALLLANFYTTVSVISRSMLLSIFSGFFEANNDETFRSIRSSDVK